VNKAETLRGRGAFASVYAGGTKLEGTVLRCFFRIDRGAGTLLRAGFSVSSRNFNAVQRNRIRRLMRVAFDGEAGWLRRAVGADRCVAMVFIFKGRKGFAVTQLKLEQVRTDISSLCRRCATAITATAT